MILRLFFLAFISFFSHVYSNVNNIFEVPCASSIMTIESVDVFDKTTLFLNNKTAWTCKYKDLFEGPYGWHLGDRVHIEYVYSEGYYLQNASCQGYVPVKLQNADSEDLQVSVIKEIIKNHKRPTTTIVLSDETRWFIGSWSSAWMRDWQAGDRIVVTMQQFIFGNADHLLLNLDRGRNNSPENIRAQLVYSPEIVKFEDHNKRETRDWKTTIDYTQEEKDSLIIELNNRTVWKCFQPKFNWQIGDELEFDLDDEKCKLVNLRNSEKINATFISDFSEEIDLPVIQKVSNNGKGITLSDESVWFSRNGRFKQWQIGNRIIISSLSKVAVDTSTHVLINIDKSTEDKNIRIYSLATLVK